MQRGMRSGLTAMHRIHPALPVDQAQDVPPDIAARLDSGNWVTRLPRPRSSSRLAQWICVPPRKINPNPVGRPYFERAVPPPLQARRLQLQQDTFLKGDLQKPAESLAWYAKEVEQRQQAENKGEEYSLPTLAPTLTNMHLFIEHLLANRHFADPLSDAERRALQQLDTQATILLKKNVPYKRTVLLSCVFATLYDLLVQQRVLAPLAQQQPELTQERMGLPSLWSFGFASQEPGRSLQRRPVATIEPGEVMSCRWHDLQLGERDEKECLLAGEELLYADLPRLLNEQSVFFYPCWEPLDVRDFCLLGHLPVYPLGLITTYATNADGIMHSPLQFLIHDLFHTDNAGNFLFEKDWHPLYQPGGRCRFRRLMLDRLPEPLAYSPLKNAVELLVFHLLHEIEPTHAVSKLEAGSFVRLMWAQAVARREHWCNYSRAYQAIPDQEGTLAALWIHRLFAHWETSGFQLTDAQLDSFTQQFVTNDLPELNYHLAYIKQHQTALRELFLSEAREIAWQQKNDWEPNRKFACKNPLFLNALESLFFHWNNPHCGCCIDHSDVVYFDRLHQDGGPEQMEQATGSPIVRMRACQELVSLESAAIRQGPC